VNRFQRRLRNAGWAAGSGREARVADTDELRV
jgi:hypothetical protein